MTSNQTLEEGEIRRFGQLVGNLTGVAQYDHDLLASNLAILKRSRASIGDIEGLLEAFQRGSQANRADDL